VLGWVRVVGRQGRGREMEREVRVHQRRGMGKGWVQVRVGRHRRRWGREGRGWCCRCWS
jgi:hypothetical protein